MRRLIWIPGAALVALISGGVVLAAAWTLGFIDQPRTMIAAGIAALAAAGAAATPFLVSLSRVGAALETLGPDGPAEVPSAPLALRPVWPALLRLRRGWRERAAGAELRLAAAEAVIAAIPDPVILIDRRRRIVRANAASAAFVGAVTEPRDLAGALRNPVLLGAVDGLLRGEAIASVEFTLSVPVERVLRAHLARIDAAAGTVSGPDGAVAILTLHDVTELKRSEQMRADFVAHAGHELKTPLAVLTGFVETLRGPARNDAAARERFLAIMHEQARRMARLVDDLLSLSRIELNEHVAPTGRVALAPVIEEVARGLELRAAERGMGIDLAMPPGLPAVQGDRDELSQIFQNLLDNAVKYGRPNTRVSVTGGTGTGAAAGMVRIAVADQGEGIPAQHLPRLTERFYRVDTARSRELGGTGLGLAIVKHIVNRHRGRLEIDSRVGQGSTFAVWLPVA